MTTEKHAGLDLAAIEGRHAPHMWINLIGREFGPECWTCEEDHPCDAALRLAEVRALRAVADAARRMAYALDLRAGDAGGYDAADRVEERYGNHIACRYFDLCEALAGRGTPLSDALDGDAPHVAGEAPERALERR